MPRLSNIILPFIGTCILSQATQAAYSTNYLSNARNAADQLMSWYDEDTGLFNSTGWWNTASALTSLADIQGIDSDSNFGNILQNSYDANKDAFTKSGFYDDEGWWALLWIKAYDSTQNQEYLQTAIDLFDDMAGGWTTNCNGGIWWDKDHTYVNVIANELFVSVAAHLARRTWDIKYLDWANAGWEWFQNSGMINSDNNINDGLDGNCQNNGYAIWSYNQGVIVGALVEMSYATFDPSYLTTASTIAWAGIHNLTDSNGILQESCQGNCGGDVSQFKGIFMRNVANLYFAIQDQGLKNFLQDNAESIWKNDKDSDNQLGLYYSGPCQDVDASTHSSALDGLIAAAAVQLV